MNEKLLYALDLDEYLSKFESLLSRKKSLFISGDTNIHYECICELCKHEFNEPPLGINNLDDELARLSKQAILHISEISQFCKIINYFLYLKKLKFEGALSKWLDKIIIPQDMHKIAKSFDKNGDLKDEVDIRLIDIKRSIAIKTDEITTELKRIIYTKSLAPYLVDSQIHYINGTEALLVRGGFNHVLKASIISRSAGGHFYVEPDKIITLKAGLSKLNNEKEMIIYEHAKNMSAIMNKMLAFLKFINGAFDIFDAYQARVRLAKMLDYEFILPSGGNYLVLKDFSHPALKNPKPINIDFNRKVLLITGVNAGGKSMLLKSLISAAFMAKYLLPMKINAAASKIGSFKEFDAIIEDPQNVKNDISTFAGRMLHFSKLFSKRNLLIGIDEIELGTDFEEAASLYGIIIEQLIKNDIKIIITTHHKRLAMLLAKNDDVELVAALYDENAQKPKFEFLKGTIGKSYAFETALRYGISQNLVKKAKELYGENKENLNELITKTLNLEQELKQRLEDVRQKQAKLDHLIQIQKDSNESEEKKIRLMIYNLEKEYENAIKTAKSAINLSDMKDKQRTINAANELKKSIKHPESKVDNSLKIGDSVKYANTKGVLISLGKKDALIDVSGINLRVPLNLIRKYHNNVAKPQNASVKLSVQKPKTASLSLDLHGLRAEEALEKLDKFISDALIIGFSEVSVYHGIGTGRLSRVVKDFLSSHPSVKSFSDAPPNQGGFGAKIVQL